MAGRSSDFLEVHQAKPSRHRSRSSGYVDFLEDQERSERQRRDKAMKKYHDARYAQQPQSVDRLYVPPFENAGHRRVRSYEEIGETKNEEEHVKTYNEPVRSYNLREQRPKYDLSSDTPLPSQLPVRRESWKPPQRKPSIKVQIHQDDTPSTAMVKTTTTPKRSPNASPGASPRSPSAQPQLQYQFATLQNLLSEIRTICAPNLHVEAANPRDLTFAKISEEVGGYAFQLRAWGHIAHIEHLARIDSRKREIVQLASHTMDKILNRVSELGEVCSKARPRDLKVIPLPEIDDSDGYDSYDDEDEDDDDNGSSSKDVTESLGFIIQAHLRGIRMNIQTLGRLTMAIQEAAPDAKDEVVAVDRLVGEVGKYFGSEEALDRYAIDARFAGRKALEEARFAARSRG